MVDKIAIEIGLEGGAEVEQQLGNIADGLKNVGDTGVDAFDKIQSAVQNAAAFEQVVQGVKKVEGAFDALGTAVGRMATRMTRSLGVFGVLARSLGPLGIGLGVLTGAFIKFGDEAAKSLGSLNVEAAKLGVTVQQFDQLQKALTKLGVTPDAVTSSLEKLKGVLTGGLFRLGDIAPPEATAGLQQFIAQLEKMPDGIARTQIAIQTLGEALGGQVIAGLQTGTITAQTFASAMAGVTPATQEQIVAAEKYQQALNQLNAAWTQLKDNLTAPVLTPAIEWLASQIPGIAAGIATTVREFQALWSVINQIGSVGAQVIGGLVEMVNTLGRAVAWVVEQFLKLTGLKTGGGGASTVPGMAGGGLLGGRGTGTSDSNLAWLSRGEYVMPANAVRRPGVLSFLEALRRSGGIPGYADGGAVGGAAFGSIFNSTIGLLKNAVVALRQVQQGFNISMANVVRSIDSLATPFNQSIDNVVQTIVAAADTLQELNRATGNAGGGLLGGRGTGTSDSNLAWVSRGEHIMPARAVQQPGVLAFLEALRRSGGNLNRVLGGLVPRMPAFAAGGLAGGSNVTIQFPGLPAIGGLRASSGVVDQLHKAAALAQVRSGGRKPSRYS